VPPPAVRSVPGPVCSTSLPRILDDADEQLLDYVESAMTAGSMRNSAGVAVC
jgi:hypothetical protein